MRWSPEQDAVLRETVLHADGSWLDIASRVASVIEVPLTADMVRNRAARIGVERPDGASFEEIDIPSIPVREFVGFRLGFFDIESTALFADIGRMLCGSIADVFGVVESYRIDRLPGKNVIDDGPLVTAYRDALERYDCLVGWNSIDFDRKFLNPRLLRAGERPLNPAIMHIDLLKVARQQIRLTSRRLENVQEFARVENAKTHPTKEDWQLAAAGDSGAIDKLVERSTSDVLVTRDVFAWLKPMLWNITRKVG